MRTIAIPLLVFKLTGSALNLGLTFALEYFSFGIFSLIGGSLADRLNRKHLMIGCDTLRFAIIATFALGYVGGWLSLALLYGGIVLHAACGAIFNGGQASSIPYVLGKSRATRAVGALAGTESAVGTVTPPLGGAIFGLVGPLPALIVNAATYVASLASLGMIRDLGPETTSGFPRLRHIVEDIGIGFRFLLDDRAMRMMTWSSFTGNFFGMLGFTAYVPFIKRDLGGSDLSVGIAFGAIGAGAVLGSLVAPHLRFPFGKIVIATYLWNVVYIPLIWTHSFTVTAIVLGIGAIAAGASITQILGWRMRIIPEETVGRVFGAVRLLVLAGTLPGALIGGALADAYGARITIIVFLAGTYAVALWLATNRTIREERR